MPASLGRLLSVGTNFEINGLVGLENKENLPFTMALIKKTQEVTVNNSYARAVSEAHNSYCVILGQMDDDWGKK